MRLVDLIKKKGDKEEASGEKSEKELAGEEQDDKPENGEARDSEGDEATPEPDSPPGALDERDEPLGEELPEDFEPSPPAFEEEEEEGPPETFMTDAYLSRDEPEDLDLGTSEEDLSLAKKTYLKALSVLKNFMDELKSDAAPDPEPLKEAASSLISEVDPDRGIFMLTMEEPEEHFLVTHSVNVALYSLKLGVGLGYDAESLKNLALAGLLHDAGMFKVSPEIVEKEGASSEKELQEIRKHPLTGYEMVKSLGPEFDRVAKTVLGHHERVDGSGYPKGLTGEAISEMSQVVGLAETYETLTHNRPYRKAIPPFDAVKVILEEERGKFTPKMLKLFLQEISIFPVNSLVRLNNQAIARVVSLNKNLPLRPMVKVIINPQGKRLEHEEVLDLSRNPLIYISSSVSADEVGVSNRMEV